VKWNYLDLFSGIGGFALGAYWAGLVVENHYYSEVDPYAIEVYQRRFPDAVPLGDVRSISKLPDGKWIITGGFPCQPFSSAARGRNNAIDLWPEMLRVVRRNHTEWVIAENVSYRAISRAVRDLREIGYSAHALYIPSAAVGAAHYRGRFWMVAYADSYGKSYGSVNEKVESIPSVPGLGDEIDPGAVGTHDGISRRLDRLKGLGNAIVPQIAEMIFREILSNE